MEHKLTVDAIRPGISQWMCKIQVVEKFRPRDSKDHTVHFQTIIVQDENEQQVAIVLYGADIDKFHKRFTPFTTYLLSGATVRDPRPYSIPVHEFEWVADRYTIVEPISTDDTSETPLPPPSKLNIISFLDLEQQQLAVEFNLIAVVTNCTTLQHTTNQGKRYREAIIVDNKKKPFMFTIWDDLTDHEGTELEHHLHEHPVILAKRVAVTEYRKVRRVATRYSSTISINPPYTQATALMNWYTLSPPILWLPSIKQYDNVSSGNFSAHFTEHLHRAKDNDQMLMAYTLRSSSASCSTLNISPMEDEVISISAIPTMSSTVQLFSIEGNISLPDRFQSYYLLACANCNHFVRGKTQRKITCLQCAVQSMLLPRCHFEVDITDNTGTLTAVVSETLAETILSMTAEQVYDIVARKDKSPPLAQINQKFNNKLFEIQLHRAPFKIPDQKINALAISSFLEKESTLLRTLPVPTFVNEATKKMKKDTATPKKP